MHTAYYLKGGYKLLNHYGSLTCRQYFAILVLEHHRYASGEIAMDWKDYAFNIVFGLIPAVGLIIVIRALFDLLPFTITIRIQRKSGP